MGKIVGGGGPTTLIRAPRSRWKDCAACQEEMYHAGRIKISDLDHTCELGDTKDG